MDRARLLTGFAILLFQAVMIGHARFTPARYFCWAPLDIQTEYRLEVSLDGKPLSAAGIERRYRRPNIGVDSRSIQHLKDIVEQYERTYGSRDHAQVAMTYRVNGKEEQKWIYPGP
jgi:hypothetical protein